MISYGLYLLLIVSYFLHLTARLPWLGAIRFDLVMIVLVLVFSFMEQKQETDRQDHSTKFLWAIIIYIFFSLPFVTWPGSVLRTGLLNYLKVVVFYFFTVSIIRTEGRLKAFIFVFLACTIFRFVEPAYLHVTVPWGYWGSGTTAWVGGKMEILPRLSGAPSDVINPNQLAWLVVSTIPFLYYLGWQGKHRLKILSAAVASVGVYTLMLTGSRSGLISLIVTIITILIYGKGKSKRILIGMILLIPIGFFIAGKLSPELGTRYLSTVEGGIPGSASAEKRISSVVDGISTLGTRFLLGHGLSTSVETNANLAGDAQISHNLYLEIAQELGLVGLFLFLMYMRGIYRNLTNAKSILRDTIPGNRWMIALTNAVLVWFIMDVVYSLSCFGLNSWEWYFFGGISVVSLRLARLKQQEQKRVATLEQAPKNNIFSPAAL
jgi:putative inorganic carbon (hco3(-)) transporter